MRLLALGSMLSLTALVSAQSLTTTMAGGFVLNGFAGANTGYCEITVTAPGGIYVNQVDVRGQGGPSGSLQVYRTDLGLTAAANRTNPAAWRLLASGPVPTVTVGTPIPVLLNDVIHLPQGTFGLALVHNGFQEVYTNPTTPVVLPTVYSDANLTIDCTASVIQNSLPTNPFFGGVSAARLPNMTIYYSLSGHTSDFTAAPLDGTRPQMVSGLSGLIVSFQDQSATSDPIGIFGWDWDFGDGSPHDFTPNPNHTYAACGDYNVTLTSTDINGNVAFTKSAFVRIDEITPSFTYTKTGNPAVFTFTNTSSPTATSFAWDLDGIPGTDATGPTAAFSYPTSCSSVNVTLTASNACRSVQVTRPLVPTAFLESLFNSNNAGTAGGSNLFDINVTAPDGLELCSLALNCNDAVGGTPIQVTVYTRPTTYVGSELTSAGWTNHGATLGVAAARDRETTVTLASPIYLAPGSHGVAINVTGIGLAYSGTGTNPAPGLLSYANADATLSLGHATSALFSGTSFTPRIFNGRLNYRTAPQGLGAYHTFGTGCAGTLGVPTNVGIALPHLGQPWTMQFNNIPLAMIPIYGLSNTFSGVIPLPIDMTPLGAPGCSLRIDPAFNGGFFLAVGNSVTWTLNVPNSNVFLGLHVYTQGFSFDAVNTLGGVFSDAATALIGN